MFLSFICDFLVICPCRFFAIGIIIFLSFWIWLTLALSFWCRLFVILVSFLCHFGGARREGGRGRAPTEICTFPEAFSFFVILESFFGHFWSRFFCQFWSHSFAILESFFVILVGRGGREEGWGRAPDRNLHISRAIVIFLSFWCHFCVILVGRGGREGGGRAPDRNLHISRGIVIFFGVIFCHLVGCGTREGRAG